MRSPIRRGFTYLVEAAGIGLFNKRDERLRSEVVHLEKNFPVSRADPFFYNIVNFSSNMPRV